MVWGRSPLENTVKMREMMYEAIFKLSTQAQDAKCDYHLVGIPSCCSQRYATARHYYRVHDIACDRLALLREVSYLPAWNGDSAR